MKRSLLLLTLAACSLPLLAGQLTVTPNPALVPVNGTARFSVSGDTSAGPVRWQVVPARLGTIDGSGLFTASGAPGQGMVRASAHGGADLGHAMVRVLPSGARRLIVSVEPPAARLAVGAAQQFGATVTGLDGDTVSGFELSWKVVPSDLGRIAADGQFTPQRPGRGRVVAVATRGLARGIGQARVSVGGQTPAGGLEVSVAPQRLRLEPGATSQFSVGVSDDQGNPVPAEIQYRLAPASLGRIEPSGSFTASERQGTGVLSVQARYQGMTGRARALITVGREVKRYRVVLRPKQTTLRPQQSTDLEALCFDVQGNQVVPPGWVWKVVPERLGTVTPEGLFTAGERPGQGKVVAALPPEFGLGQDFASVRIRPGLPNQVRIDPPKAVVRPGQSQQFTAMVTDPQGKPLNVPGLVWRVFPQELGSITPGGLFTAGQTPKLGTVVALVPPENGGGRGVAVVGVSSYNVLITGPRPRQLQAGETHQFQAEIRDQAGNLVSGVSWEWSSSSLSPAFGHIDPASGVFTAGQPLVAQVEGNVFVKARVGGTVVGANGIHVYVHRR